MQGKTGLLVTLAGEQVGNSAEKHIYSLSQTSANAFVFGTKTAESQRKKKTKTASGVNNFYRGGCKLLHCEENVKEKISSQ